MADFDRDEVMVKVPIEADTCHGKFCDSLYFTQTEYDALTDKDIEDQKQARIDKWVDFMQAQKDEPADIPLKKDLLADKATLLSQIAEIDALLSKHYG